MSGLPAALDGLRVGLITDVHHSASVAAEDVVAGRRTASRDDTRSRRARRRLRHVRQSCLCRTGGRAAVASGRRAVSARSPCWATTTTTATCRRRSNGIGSPSSRISARESHPQRTARSRWAFDSGRAAPKHIDAGASREPAPTRSFSRTTRGACTHAAATQRALGAFGPHPWRASAAAGSRGRWPRPTFRRSLDWPRASTRRFSSAAESEPFMCPCGSTARRMSRSHPAFEVEHLGIACEIKG